MAPNCMVQLVLRELIYERQRGSYRFRAWLKGGLADLILLGYKCLPGAFGAALFQRNMEPDKGSFIDYCPLERAPFQVPC